MDYVAPCVGAWIETRTSKSNLPPPCTSHPVWVRGLKQRSSTRKSSCIKSHPVWVRGLKQKLLLRITGLAMSHPVWVRGLKHDNIGSYSKHQRRTLCGCVD